MLHYDPFLICKAHLAFWNSRNVKPLLDLLAPAATLRAVYEKEAQPAARALAEGLTLWHEAFPDLAIRHTNTIPTPGALTIQWVLQGTHTGIFREIPPTGRVVEVPGATVLKVNEDGKIHHGTVYVDMATILHNLGTLPKVIPEDRAREIIFTYVEAINHRDLQRAESLLTPAFTCLDWTGRTLTAAEYRDRTVRNIIATPDLKMEVRQMAIRGHEVVVEGVLRGTHLHPTLGHPAAGHHIHLEVCWVFTLSGEKIERLCVYEDQLTLLAQMGVISDLVQR
jgi:steroid delta-isomerase-like uncharacterized protein